MAKPDSFVTSFRSAAPYIHTFRDKIFVIAFGGEVVQGGKFFNLVHDLNLLESLGVRLVLVSTLLCIGYAVQAITFWLLPPPSKPWVSRRISRSDESR